MSKNVEHHPGFPGFPLSTCAAHLANSFISGFLRKKYETSGEEHITHHQAILEVDITTCLVFGTGISNGPCHPRGQHHGGPKHAANITPHHRSAEVNPTGTQHVEKKYTGRFHTENVSHLNMSLPNQPFILIDKKQHAVLVVLCRLVWFVSFGPKG